jgi:hypothetical protein
MSTESAPVWSRLDAMAEQAEENYRALVCELAEHDKTECTDDEVRDILAAAGNSTENLRRHVERAKRRIEADSRLRQISTESPAELEALKAERAKEEATMTNLHIATDRATKGHLKRMAELDSEILSKMQNDGQGSQFFQSVLKRTAEPGTDPWDWQNFRLEEREGTIPGLHTM